MAARGPAHTQEGQRRPHAAIRRSDRKREQEQVALKKQFMRNSWVEQPREYVFLLVRDHKQLRRFTGYVGLHIVAEILASEHLCAECGGRIVVTQIAGKSFHFLSYGTACPVVDRDKGDVYLRVGEHPHQRISGEEVVLIEIAEEEKIADGVN